MKKLLPGILLAAFSLVPIVFITGLVSGNMSDQSLLTPILFAVSVLLAIESNRHDFKRYRTIFGPFTHSPLALLSILCIYPVLVIPIYVNARYKVSRGISRLNDGKIDYLPVTWLTAFATATVVLSFAGLFPDDMQFIPKALAALMLIVLIPLGFMYARID